MNAEDEEGARSGDEEGKLKRGDDTSEASSTEPAGGGGGWGGATGRSKQLRGTLASALLTLLFNYGGLKLCNALNWRGLLERVGGGAGAGWGGRPFMVHL